MQPANMGAARDATQHLWAHDLHAAAAVASGQLRSTDVVAQAPGGAARDECSVDLPPDRRRRAVQLPLGHSKIESTVRYLGIEVDDAIEIAEKIAI